MMVPARQTIALLDSARHLMASLPAHAILILTETDLDWETVSGRLDGCKLLVAAEGSQLHTVLQRHSGLTLVKFDAPGFSIAERIGLAVLAGLRADLLHQGDDVIVLYNGISVIPDKPEPIDTLSVLHLGEHLESLRGSDLRRLATHVPLDTLQAVVKLATAIGREGREGHPVGALFVVGDTRKVLTMCRPINFNPFRGYPPAERDVKNRSVREQIKEIAQIDGAILIRRDGVAEAAGVRIEAPLTGVKISKGLGMRHSAAAAISLATKAVAVCVSQSSGSVRIYQAGDMVLHIEPFKRPLIFGPVVMDNGHTASRVGEAKLEEPS